MNSERTMDADGQDSILMPGVSRQGVEPRRARWVLALILLLAFGLRSRDLIDPWSGIGMDFRSQFGGFATGGPARNFEQHGYTESGFMPYYWRLELADGDVDYGWYAHHPALFAVLTGLSLDVFGIHEWAARLPWLVFNLLSIVSLYRLVAVLWGRRQGLWAAFWCAVLPLSVFVGTMVWVDTAVVWLQCLLLRQYVLWLRSGRGRHLAWAAGWAFLGGMFEWTSGYLLPTLGLHALWFCTKSGGVKRLLQALAIPLAALTAVGIHALHMRLVLPDTREGDTSGTLAWVTQLHGEDTLGFFLSNQLTYFERYLTWPVLALVALVLLTQLVLGLRGRLTREDWLFVAMVAPGPIYIGFFPARSINHDFFVFLSTPYLCMALTAGVAWVGRRLAAFAVPAGWTTAVLALVLTGCAVHRSFFLWAIRYGTRLERLVETDWLAPILADEKVVLFPVTGKWMPIHFHARATVIHEFTSEVDGRTPRERLTEYRDRVLSRLPADRRVLVLVDQEEMAQFAAVPSALDFFTFLQLEGDVSIRELPPQGPRDTAREFLLVDLTRWVHASRM